MITNKFYLNYSCVCWWFAIIPKKEELFEYLKNNPHRTYTAISKNFDIEMGTVRDLVKTYFGDLVVIKIGTALMVDLKWIN